MAAARCHNAVAEHAAHSGRAECGCATFCVTINNSPGRCMHTTTPGMDVLLSSMRAEGVSVTCALCCTRESMNPKQTRVARQCHSNL